MTREEFLPVAAYLSAAVQKPMPRDQAEVYFDLLHDLPAAAVSLAARRAVAENRYPTIPPVGTIRALALEASVPAGLSCPEAWELTLRAVRRFGMVHEGDGLDSLPPAARRAAECIGWRALCDMNPSDADTLRAQYRDFYGTFRQREECGRLLPAKLREELSRLVGGIGALPGPPGG